MWPSWLWVIPQRPSIISPFPLHPPMLSFQTARNHSQSSWCPSIPCKNGIYSLDQCTLLQNSIFVQLRLRIECVHACVYLNCYHYCCSAWRAWFCHYSLSVSLWPRGAAAHSVREPHSRCTKAAFRAWAGRNAGTRQLSKECSLGSNSLAENEGEKWIQNVELACSYKVIRRAGCSTWAAGCIFWVLSVCRPSYSHGPDCFDAAQSGCLLLLTAEVCDLKCVLSTECKGTWHFKSSAAADAQISWNCHAAGAVLQSSAQTENVAQENLSREGQIYLGSPGVGWLVDWLVGFSLVSAVNMSLLSCLTKARLLTFFNICSVGFIWKEDPLSSQTSFLQKWKGVYYTILPQEE